MSFRAVHAGAGYQYLLCSVAASDAHDESVETGKLSSYYQAKGTSPGRWIGRGLAALRSETAAVGVEIEADQIEPFTVWTTTRTPTGCLRRAELSTSASSAGSSPSKQTTSRS